MTLVSRSWPSLDSRVEARVHPLHVELWQGGRQIARHERCDGRRQQALDPKHYLDVLGHKPGGARRVQAAGAVAPSRTLACLP
ncbi:Mu transposase domain-containing protein [Roseomonas chloroacetimidivorans]|uniref:Mu transposase domain-containing protein n=1 Tax=Roseomonas chloroacetimidivorans TaxID=1766656 RepID=UPI003C77E435